MLGLNKDLRLLKSLQSNYTSYIKWLWALNDNVKIGNNPEHYLNVYFEWSFPYCKPSFLGGYDAFVELSALCYNLGCLWFNTGMLYIESDFAKGFILAKGEFFKAFSLFQYWYDNFYDKTKVKPIPIEKTILGFIIDLTQVLVTLWSIVEINEKEAHKMNPTRILEKFVELVKYLETLLKHAKKDKKFGAKYIGKFIFLIVNG